MGLIYKQKVTLVRCVAPLHMSQGEPWRSGIAGLKLEIEINRNVHLRKMRRIEAKGAEAEVRKYRS